MDGKFRTQYPDPEYDIILDEDECNQIKRWFDEGEKEGTKMGQIAGVINHDIAKKMEADEEK